VTGLAWKTIYGYDGADGQSLIGSLCDGSILRWTPSMNNTNEKILLNPKN